MWKQVQTIFVLLALCDVKESTKFQPPVCQIIYEGQSLKRKVGVKMEELKQFGSNG